MSVHCFTSFTFSYLGRALILAWTLKSVHPDWKFWALIVDKPPPTFNFAQYRSLFDGLVYAEELDLPRFEAWLFKHDIVEACTAVKAEMARFLLRQPGAEKVLYIDPDIAVFHPLEDMLSLLERHAIVLTPHQTEPANSVGAVWDNEVSSLQHGAYNLGFVGLRNCESGLKFCSWWADRLYLACYNDVQNGIFTDQKWCDLVPCFFDNVYINRDPGCNVASWNLSNRRIRILLNGDILVNESPLKFYHFTKIGLEGDMATEKYAGENTAIYEIWNWYKRTLASITPDGIPNGYWFYGAFSNGIKIPRAARLLFRQRQDLFDFFGAPFDVDGNSFYAWLQREQPEILAASNMGRRA